ncbi:MAG: SLC13 family permease [Planctomycetota bacterium]
MNPIVILIIGVTLLIAMIIVLRVNAFVALITAAIIISLLAPGDFADKVSRVAEAFGSVVGAIGIVIALATVIGKCLMDSGAADRIVRSFLKAMGEKRASTALMASGFVLSVPVFFDTVFYLLVPLARSLYRRTQKNYVLYLTAIVAGAGITHTLVPPTPGPLFMADRFGIDLGVMMGMGILVGLPTAALGLLVCKLINRFVDIPMRPYTSEAEPEPLDDDQLPGFWTSIAPIILPVILISMNTVTKALDVGGPVAQITAVLGNPNLALLLSAAIAMFVLVRSRGLSLKELSGKMDTALMSGGIIILITAGGGAFGAMLRAAGVQDVVKGFVDTDTGGQGLGLAILLLAFAVSSIIKFSQGSGTVAMITTASMFAAMGISEEMLGCNLVYLAMAIGGGSLVGDWMNNSGFWIFARMGGLTEIETLKSWTILTAALGLITLAFTLLFASILPLV